MKYCSKMGLFIQGFVHLTTVVLFFNSQALGVTMEGVKLMGETNSYINMKSRSPYRLVCTYRTGYDDPVYTVNWYKDGSMAYSWNEGDTISTSYGKLIGRVATTSKSDLQNIYFTGTVPINLSGNYTCEIVSKKETVKSEPFQLVVLDIPSDDFVSNVTLMSDMEDEQPSEDETRNCTLVWDFKTPAIYPRPNVTCGYYSYLHDDVTSSVPAGLTMQLLNNGSWQAGFEHTHVQVEKIPPKKRLGCSVSVPDTTFKKVIKFEDNFALDYLIDAEGCPLWFTNSDYRVQYHYDEGETNCRGDLVPATTGGPLVVKFWCDPGDMVLFPNGTAWSSWSAKMTCDPTDLAWKIFNEESNIWTPVDLERDLPHCLPNPNSGQRAYVSWHALFIVFMVLAYPWFQS